MDYSNLFVCLLGMGIVFFGLIMLIALVSVMSRVVMATDKKPASTAPAVAAPAAAPVAAAATVTPAMVAAISAAIAEASGTDAAALRIVSIKQI